MTAPTQLRRLGKDSRLYILDDFESPTTFTRVDTRDTLAVKDSMSLEDVSAEDSDGVMWQQPILQQNSIEASAFRSASSDAAVGQLSTAKAARTPLPIAIADGDITVDGTTYRKYELYVSQMDENKDIKSPVKASIGFVAGPVDPTHVPTDVTVGA